MKKLSRSLFLLISLVVASFLGSVSVAQQAENVYGLPVVYMTQSTNGISLQVAATRFNSSNPNVTPFDLLSIAEVRQELELVEEQETEFKNIYATLQERLDETFGNMTEAEIGEKQVEIQEFAVGMREDAKKQFKELLLPEQIDRLRSHLFRRRAKSTTLIEVLTSDEVVEKAGITRKQESELKEKDKDLEREFAEKIRALKVEYRNQLIEDLDQDQKEEIKKLFGDDFFQK